ncbi:MAG TPA: DMT family transporter [Cryptosporangiaceae bacterium]|nr:DMT family transporter [Cryptosporangiaceae bacterium]
MLASVLALGALGTGLAFVLHFRVIRVAGASTGASVTYLIPIAATVIGVVALGERMSWHQPVGALIVLTGVAVSQGVLRLPTAWSRRPAPEPEPELAPVPPPASAPTPTAVPRCAR